MSTRIVTEVCKEAEPSKAKRLCGDLPAETFTAFKIEVIRSGLTMAQGLNQAVELWLQKRAEDTQTLIKRAEEEIKQLTENTGTC